MRTQGAAAFEAAVEQAVPLSRQLVAQASAGGDLATAEGRARLLATARPLWGALPEGAMKRQMLGEFARLAQLAADEVLDLWQPAAERPRRSAVAAAPVAGRPAPPPRRRPQAAPRGAPAGPADLALRLLLVHSEWWDRLDADDHALLHDLPPPHGPLFGWLERQLAEHGPLPWTALAAALAGDEGGAAALALVTSHTLADEADHADLGRVLDGLWVERLADEQKSLIATVAADPAALGRWRAVETERRRRLERLRGGAAGSAAAIGARGTGDGRR